MSVYDEEKGYDTNFLSQLIPTIEFCDKYEPSVAIVDRWMGVLGTAKRICMNMETAPAEFM